MSIMLQQYCTQHSSATMCDENTYAAVCLEETYMLPAEQLVW